MSEPIWRTSYLENILPNARSWISKLFVIRAQDVVLHKHATASIDLHDTVMGMYARLKLPPRTTISEKFAQDDNSLTLEYEYEPSTYIHRNFNIGIIKEITKRHAVTPPPSSQPASHTIATKSKNNGDCGGSARSTFYSISTMRVNKYIRIKKWKKKKKIATPFHYLPFLL